MEVIKTVGVKTLKNQLSAYLREVKNGVHVLVTDHDVVVAELRQPSLGSAVESTNPILAQWVREGKVRLPLSKERTVLKLPKLNLPQGTAQRVLDEERGE